MSNIDKRNKLNENPFEYTVTKDEKVFVSYEGKQIKSLKGKEAKRLLSKLQSAGTEKDIQLLLAKITGNFKRGNEK
ncbi:hypothetical protein E2R51_12905 [Jeotgalibacillus sp. S-D1]|uniref:hypothetical protein n=1 Tax=Jeotgalibacillus sp. S-D1 TaxID=2552189 RepID=UPI00105A0B39|nr:hypothetical protein [Jeotgalibacillus sp. S-D1]TDL31268.1 hypothetical protein E2R51_12905 [Jeotgalibacillus sp. S-D1]